MYMLVHKNLFKLTDKYAGSHLLRLFAFRCFFNFFITSHVAYDKSFICGIWFCVAIDRFLCTKA